MLSDQLRDDRNLQFTDWSTPITYREVAQTYDPHTGLVSEVHTDHSIAAILAPAPSSPTPNTAAQHLTADLHLLIQSEALATPPSLTARILHANTEYTLLAFTPNPLTQTTTLHLRRRK